MRLTIDVGNTNSVAGRFSRAELSQNWGRLNHAGAEPRLMSTACSHGICLRWRDWTRSHHRLRSHQLGRAPVKFGVRVNVGVYFDKALFVELGVKTGMAVLVDIRRKSARPQS